MARTLSACFHVCAQLAVVGLAVFQVSACGDKPSNDPDPSGLPGPWGPDATAPVSGGTTPDAGTSAQDSGAQDAADSGPTDTDSGVPGCPASTLPTGDACSIDEGFAVFASVSRGTPSGDGTRAHPFVSVQTAINAAMAAHKRVYACAESYPETLTFADGVSVFGYFDCTGGTWTSSAGRAHIASPSSPAAHATNIVTATRIEGVEIIAPDATVASGSSIGLIATGSTALTFVHSRIHAGAGKKGDDGVDGIQLTQGGTLFGSPNTAENECSLSRFLCDVNNSGGVGGTSVCNGAPGHNAAPGGAGGFSGRYMKLFVPNGTGGGSFMLDVVDPPTNGLPQPGGGTTLNLAQGGTAGVAGAPGTAGVSAAAMGLFSANGFVPADGSSGTDGAPGGGGAGGAGRALSIGEITDSTANWYGISGAGGGAGGCPGLAGTAGKGGGASVAVIAIDSPLALVTCTIESSAGGDGGKGTLGSAPTTAGSAGQNQTASANSAAGPGGSGGASGTSGNGAGGPSVGIASHGLAPSGSIATVSTGGAGAPAITGGGKTVAASPAGISAASQAF